MVIDGIQLWKHTHVTAFHPERGGIVVYIDAAQHSVHFGCTSNSDVVV